MSMKLSQVKLKALKGEGTMKWFVKILVIGLVAILLLPSYGYAAPAPAGPAAGAPEERAQPYGRDGISYPAMAPTRADDIGPQEGENKPYLYDLQVSRQVQYWGRVVDGLAQKFASQAEDPTSLDDLSKIWEFADKYSIELNKQETKILCLLSPEAPDAKLVSRIPNWPKPKKDSWPLCGGIVNEMFGPGAVAYLKNLTDDNRKKIFAYLLESMGLSGSSVQNSILGPGEEFPDVGGDDELKCFTPGNNIKTYDINNSGVLNTVTNIIKGLLNQASEKLVNATADDPKFKSAVLAAMVLYISIYGAMVVLGLVNIALGDALVRIAKVGVVAMLVSSATIRTFFDIFRCFFIEGTTYLVAGVSKIGVEAVLSFSQGVAAQVNLPPQTAGGINICGPAGSSTTSPLAIMEVLLQQVFSSHMFLILITLLLSKIYGFILMIFLLVALFGFVLSLLGAVTIYLTSLIAQYLLLSLLPFFMAFLLFDRTKYLFQGWLNQLITYSLVPIFLFAYISLFVVVIEAALAQVLDVKICWDKWINIAWVFDIYKWHFWDYTTDQPAVDLPFGFFEILILVLLTFLMKEFEGQVKNIAEEIGGSYSYADNAARGLKNWFMGKGSNLKNKAVSQAASGAKTGGTFARGAIKGHDGGVRGLKGGKEAVAASKANPGGRGKMPRK